MGTVDVEGRDVAVVAGGDAEGLVGVGAEVELTVVLDGAAYPPPRGEQIGVVRVSAGGRRFGEFPLIVSGLPPPPPPGSGSWWEAAFGAVANAAEAVLGGLLD